MRRKACPLKVPRLRMKDELIKVPFCTPSLYVYGLSTRVYFENDCGYLCLSVMTRDDNLSRYNGVRTRPLQHWQIFWARRLKTRSESTTRTDLTLLAAMTKRSPRQRNCGKSSLQSKKIALNSFTHWHISRQIWSALGEERHSACNCNTWRGSCKLKN